MFGEREYQYCDHRGDSGRPQPKSAKIFTQGLIGRFKNKVHGGEKTQTT